MPVVPSRPAGISAPGKGAVWFVPTVANPAAPTVTEILAGFPLQSILYSFNLSAEQGTVESPRYSDEQVPERLGRAKYSVDDFVYDYDPQAPDAATGDYAHYADLAPGTNAYLFDRRGLAHDVDPAATQWGYLIPIQLGAQVPVQIDPGEEDSTLRVTQKVAVRGDVEMVEVAAGA